MSNPVIVSRQEWGAEPATVKPYNKADLPIYTIYVSLKSFLPECKSKEECIKVLKEAQKKAIKEDKLPDIPYSFVIGSDGLIYEGRGWEKKPQKAIMMEEKDFDPTAYDISFFGDFSPRGKDLPFIQFKALLGLLETGVKKKFVFEEYDLEPFRKDKYEPVFRPGKDKFKNMKPIKVKGVTQGKPYKEKHAKSFSFNM